MNVVRWLSVLVALAGAAVLAIVLAPSVHGQRTDRGDREPDRRARDLAVLAGRGVEIGASVRDPDSAEASRQKLTGGAVVEDVRPDSPAERAGLKRSDIVVEFDGERVRSARQFGRLVEETPPGRTVPATLLRDGKRTQVHITPEEGRGLAALVDGERLRDRLGDLGALAGRLPPVDFDFDLRGWSSGRRLGVTVEEMSDQLADYFGANNGVLVGEVTDDSSAARAGLKAGDVITSFDGRQVRSRADVVRGLRDATGDQVTLGIVRDKKAMTIKVEVNGRP